MKRFISVFRLAALIVLLLPSMLSRGAYLKNVPFVIHQPDGQEITCYISGDEYYTFLHDANDYTIVKDDVTGYYVYAEISGGELVPSPFVVGQVDISMTRIRPGLNISPERWKQLRSDFWKDTPDKSDFPGYTSMPTESSGTINNLVVFIRFSDQTAFSQNISYYDGMFNDNSAGVSSMKNYFLEASYNAMDISSGFYPLPNGTAVVSYQDSYPRSYYMPYDASTNPNGYLSNQRTSREHTLLKNATNAIASQIPAGLNIDYDNDGYVDNVCYIVRGGTTAWSTLLWPHRWSLYSQTVYLQGNKRVYDYNFQLETFLDSYSVGVLAHEMFHTLGSPDLYHYTSNGIDPVGSWDVMCSNTNPPQHMSAYMKYKYGGWISSIPTISNSGTYTLNPLTSPTNNCYRINSPSSSTEYFVVEFRKKTGTFEGKVPGSGLIIYRINTQATGNANGPPDEVYVYRPNGTPTVNGSVSSAYFSSESGRTSFSNTTNPYCFLSNGNNGNIYISQIGSSAGGTISFTVSSNITADFSGNPASICPGGTVSFTDQSSGGPTSWYWDFGDGTSSTLQNPTHQYQNPGYYTVSLTASNAISSNTLTKTNYIHAASQAVSVSITANPTGPVCTGVAVTFTAVPVNGGSSPVYQWLVNGANAGTNSSSFTYIPADGDNVSVILTSNIACPSGNPATSNSIAMTVTSGTALGMPVFNTWTDVVCRGQSGVVYTIDSLAGADSYVWSISPGATLTSGQGTQSVTVSFSSTANSGTISVYGTNDCGNGPAASFNYTVITTKPPTPGPISGPGSVAPNSTQTYTIAPVVNATSYTWTKPTNTTILSGQGTTSVTLSFASNWNGGTLSVKASNCVGTSKARSIKLRKSNKGKIGDEQEELISLAKNGDPLFLFPNPATGFLNVRFTSAQEGQGVIAIYNLTGQVLLEHSFGQTEGLNELSMNIEGLPEGIYFVGVMSDAATLRKSKLVISR